MPGMMREKDRTQEIIAIKGFNDSAANMTLLLENGIDFDNQDHQVIFRNYLRNCWSAFCILMEPDFGHVLNGKRFDVVVSEDCVILEKDWDNKRLKLTVSKDGNDIKYKFGIADEKKGLQYHEKVAMLKSVNQIVTETVAARSGS